MAFVGCGRAKLLLFGEHAAVYGHPAVGLSLRTALRVHLHPEEAKGWTLQGVKQKDRGPILRVLELLTELSGQGGGNQLGGGRVLLESRIPRGLGFGSSASLCVALAGAVASRAGETDSRRIWEWAHRAEALFHGTPSGIDTGLALLGGLYSFRPRPPELPEAEPLKGVALHLVVGAVPRRDSAGALIGTLRERVMAGDRGMESILGRLGGAAATAAEILRTSGASEEKAAAGRLGALATEAHRILRDLDLSTPELEQMLEEGRVEGAIGGKLSGAGGGGAFYLVCEDSDRAGGVAAALRSLSRRKQLPTRDTIYPLSWMPERDG